LLPDKLEPAKRYPVIFVLPVEAGAESRFGDGLREVQKRNLHNTLQVIFVAPTFSHLPWYADHPTDRAIQQETYFLKVVVPFVTKTYPALPAPNGRLLLGFSKSGWGAFSLLLRHPEVFGKAAAWDAPLMMNRPDRFGMADIFGTQANFEKYQIAKLLEAHADKFAKEQRLLLTGYGNFRDHHAQVHARMTELKIAHAYRDGPPRKHDWHSGWVAEAAEWLLQHETAHVDRYGDPLPMGAIQRLGSSRFRLDGYVYSLAYSPDSRLLATGNAGYRSLTNDAGVVVWDAQTGKRIRSWVGHAHVVRSVAISADNQYVALVNGYGKLHVYDIATGKEPRRYDHVERPDHARFTPDGLLVVGDGNKVRRWEVATDKELPALIGHDKDSIGLAVAADGKTLASYARNGDVRIWNADGSERRRFKLPGIDGLVVALAPDGKRLAIGTFNNEILLHDTDTGKELWRVKTTSWRVGEQAFSPDGKVLASGADKFTLWDVATGKPLHVQEAPYGMFQHAAFAPDGSRVATFGTWSGPRFWDPATGQETLVHEGHPHAPLSGIFTPDGRTLAILADEPYVRLWDLATGTARRFAVGDHSVIKSMALSRDGKTLATSAGFSPATLWDMHTGKSLRSYKSKSFETPGGPVFIAADGKTLAAGTGNCAIRFWDPATGKEYPQAYTGIFDGTGSSLLHCLRFVLAPDGKTLATTRGHQPESGVIIWDVVTGAQRFVLADRGEPVAFSPDGRLVAILSDKEARLVDCKTGTVTRRMIGDGSRVTCAAFSPDGKTFATGGQDRVIRLWETATGQQRGQRTGHLGPVNFVAFAPDGRRLASGSDDHTALIWDLGHGVAARPLTAKEAETLWTALAGANAAKAYDAIWQLSGDPDRAVSLLQAQVRPVAPADAKRLAQLVAALDSDEFAERQRATDELQELGELAEGELRRALKGKGTLELRRRAEFLLEILYTRPPRTDYLRQSRAIEALERAGTASACKVLQSLAGGVPEAYLTRDAQAALDRLPGR
jgi:WD40 repeat protein